MADINNANSRFQVSSTDVRVPTLLIGVGGIGGRIVSSVFDQLSVVDRSVVEMIVLDTNINDIGKVEEKGINCLQTSESRTVSGYLNANPHFFDWFPNNPLISGKNLIDGAGQIRAVSRLGGLASEQAGNFRRIKECIDKLNREKGDDTKKIVKVMIVGSITGGTGSGLGIQLPFYIRSLFGTDIEVLIRGLFLCADILEEKQNTADSKKAVYVNEYAFIRELNAFYKAQTVDKEDLKITVEHYNPMRSKNDPPMVENKNPVPYDFMFLLEKNSNRNSNLGGLGIYESKAAKIVRSQLFSPVSGSQYSAEDNLIIARVENDGMNSYCSAGFSAAIYPQEHVERYCTLRHASETVSDQWLHIDSDFKKKSAEQRKLMKESSSFAPLNLRNFYMERFEKYTNPEETNAPYYIARLAEEAKCKEYDANGEVIGSKPYADEMIKNIYAYLIKELKALGLETLRDECTVNVSTFGEYASAAQNARSVLNKIENFSKTARAKVGEVAVICASQILPAGYTVEDDDESASFGKADCPYSIFDSFKNCHPITVRYLIYSLLKILKTNKEAFDVSLRSKNIEGIDRDFWPKTPGQKENIVEAIGMAKPSAARAFVNRVFMPGANINSKEYEHLIAQFANAVAEERDYIYDRAKNTLFSTVLGIIIKRLEILAEIYENFFDEMKTIVEECENELTSLEEKYTGKGKRIVDGDLYVCADYVCLNAISNDIYNNLTSDPTALSDSAKKQLFAELYTVAEKRIDKMNNTSSTAGREKSMKKIFEDGVLGPLKKEIFKEGRKYTDIGILRAIEREYKAYETYEINTSKSGLTANSSSEYLQEVFRRISELATPYLAYTSYESREIPIAISYGVNTSVICNFFSTEEEALLSSQVEDLFSQTRVAANTPIVADSFSPNELLCYKAVYDLKVENVNRYRDGEKANLCYKERLENVIDQTFKVDDTPDGYLSIVHPHLDKRWNSRAYLPMLIDATDIREDKFVKLSFLLSLALNVCRFSLDYETGYCWRYYTEKGVNSIYINRQEVINNAGIDSLLDGFNYNETVKRNVLERVLDIIVQTQNNEPLTGTTTATVVNHPVVEKLCAVEEFATNSKDGIATVYDVIYAVYVKTRDAKLANSLINAFAGFICDYCYGFSNRKLVIAKELLAVVLDKIQKASKNYVSSEKDAPDLFFAWNGAFREENFQNNLDYLELTDYLAKM